MCLEVLSLLSSVLLFYSQTFVLACLQGWGLVPLGSAWWISLLADILWLLIGSCHSIWVFKWDLYLSTEILFRAPFSTFTLHYMISAIVTVGVVLLYLFPLLPQGSYLCWKHEERTRVLSAFRLQKETKHCQCEGCGSMKAHASCVCLAGFPAPILAALMECLSMQLGLLVLYRLLPSYCIWGENETTHVISPVLIEEVQCVALMAECRGTAAVKVVKRHNVTNPLLTAWSAHGFSCSYLRPATAFGTARVSLHHICWASVAAVTAGGGSGCALPSLTGNVAAASSGWYWSLCPERDLLSVCKVMGKADLLHSLFLSARWATVWHLACNSIPSAFFFSHFLSEVQK